MPFILYNDFLSFKASNSSMMVISPYRFGRTWVFDDKAARLKQEPFVLGIPEMINDLVRDIPNARRGFRLLFSAQSFLGFQVKLERLREESGGNWYRIKGRTEEGRLCPSLFKYFEGAPKSIFAKAEPLSS